MAASGAGAAPHPSESGAHPPRDTANGTVHAIGLMTGTVLDGHIDAALIESDGVRVRTVGRYALIPYAAGTRRLLERTLAAARDWNFAATEPAIFAEAEAALTDAQADAVSTLIDGAGLTPSDISVIGFHGQSVLHRAPDRAAGTLGATRQLGDGQRMADRLGIPVAFGFRSADMAAGGQGAPLCPVYHAALLRSVDDPARTAVLNIGGVANLTWWDGAGDGADRIIGFDTGPGNAPLNDFVRAHGLGEMDRDGALASAGRVDETRLAALLRHPYLHADGPKSLDRFDFGAGMADGLGPADGAALLTAFSAAAVGMALDRLPRRPERLVVCGGGRHNPTLMRALEQRATVRVEPAEAHGWRGDAIEAECFAYLAVRTLRGLPISFPGTTGVAEPLCGGRIALPRSRLRPRR